jgi:hypothetical protein
VREPRVGHRLRPADDPGRYPRPPGGQSLGLRPHEDAGADAGRARTEAAKGIPSVDQPVTAPLRQIYLHRSSPALPNLSADRHLPQNRRDESQSSSREVEQGSSQHVASHSNATSSCHAVHDGGQGCPAEDGCLIANQRFEDREWWPVAAIGPDRARVERWYALTHWKPSGELQ